MTAVLGAQLAAKLLADAGSLRALSRVPACNLPALGAHRRQLAGQSSAS